MVLDFALIGTYITSANWNYFYISQLPLTMARTVLHPPKIDKKTFFIYLGQLPLTIANVTIIFHNGDLSLSLF